jgi:hypothetical protein
MMASDATPGGSIARQNSGIRGSSIGRRWRRFSIDGVGFPQQLRRRFARRSRRLYDSPAGISLMSSFRPC